MIECTRQAFYYHKKIIQSLSKFIIFTGNWICHKVFSEVKSSSPSVMIFYNQSSHFINKSRPTGYGYY